MTILSNIRAFFNGLVRANAGSAVRLDRALDTPRD